MEKSKNGLKLIQIKSSVKNDFGNQLFKEFSELEKFLSENFKDDGFVIVYLDYKVLIRKVEKGAIVFRSDEETFEPKFVQKLRMFNDKKEIFFWRTERGWKARLRVDGEGGEMVNAVEANQVLFGTTGTINDGFITLREDRGTEIELPFEINNFSDDYKKDKSNRVKIKTINYIDHNELGQAGYVDSRFVKFTFGKENKSIGE
ncbi:MAG: CRISPR-associated protein Csx19 [bacterium]|nr:CRISPR-associated protein Csx19 [bacterium]